MGVPFQCRASTWCAQRRCEERGEGRDQCGHERDARSGGPMQAEKRVGSVRPGAKRERAEQRDRGKRGGEAGQHERCACCRQWQRNDGCIARRASRAHAGTLQPSRYDRKGERSGTDAAADGGQRTAHGAAEIMKGATHDREHCQPGRESGERGAVQRGTGEVCFHLGLRQLRPGALGREQQSTCQRSQQGPCSGFAPATAAPGHPAPDGASAA